MVVSNYSPQCGVPISPTLHTDEHKDCASGADNVTWNLKLHIKKQRIVNINED